MRRVVALLTTTLFASLSSACRDEVALGAWGSVTVAGEGGGSPIADVTGGAAGASEAAGLPACLEPAAPGISSSPGDLVGATEVISDWVWPAPVSSLKWELMVEREISRPTPASPPTSGYYFAHQFSFVEGVVGFMGLQAEGGYQADPPSSAVDFTKMAVFWVSGPPLSGELGDIAYPDARVASATVAGVSFLTIHARFEWQACRVYRLRVGPDETESDGSTWYRASIEDMSAGTETSLGRLLLPADVGQFSPFSVSRTMPIDFRDNAACDAQAPSSVVFGAPSAEDDGIRASLATSRFVEPLRCTSSRLTELPGAVRHELGLQP